MPEAHDPGQPHRIETFQSCSSRDLQPLWRCAQPDGEFASALAHPWGARHRPDWHRRGLVIWPRGGLWRLLNLELVCPPAWRDLQGLGAGLGIDLAAEPPGAARARLVLRWWADAVQLRVDGQLVHEGDLFDTACRWSLPERWWRGEPLRLELRLRSPLHDDGALIHSRIELEPLDPADPAGLLDDTRRQLVALREAAGQPPLPPADAGFHVLGHAHLDLAWLWPVADTWQAAERTFGSALALMERFPQLHFAHSTPALYAWLQQHRPALMAAIEVAVAAGRFEPINGPWVETDCVLVSTASLLRQFEEGQVFSRAAFPTLRHELAWLPDSFGFGAGLPAVAVATGVRWFCTHKLAWNATNPFPHRLFRWRGRDGAELLALMTAPIGTDGDPVAMETYRLDWQRATGLSQALWLPGVGDHGGGPTAEMLEQLQLWEQQPAAAPQRHGTLRSYLAQLEPLAPQLPVWRDELYLELHRACATSRPDQKRHNRTLERLLREADLAGVLAGEPAMPPVDWRSLLFQQFHDILPGTSIPEVFDQAEPQWRAARRLAVRQRDQALLRWLEASATGAHPAALPSSATGQRAWWVAQLQPQRARCRTLRLPAGCWQSGGSWLPAQPAAAGGQWVQLPPLAGVMAQRLEQHPAGQSAGERPGLDRPEQPVRISGSRCSNGLVGFLLGAAGVEQLWGRDGAPLLAAPLRWCRYRDGGEFWDAWDLAAHYRDEPLPWAWPEPPVWVERGPLCASFVWRGQCGRSAVRLQGRLLAGSPWLELVLSVDWRQRHELLRLELPLAQEAPRWAADTSGGVIERPTAARTPREQVRWELPVISWMASAGADRRVPDGAADAGRVDAGPAGQAGADLAVLLDGPQGVSAAPGLLGVSLLRAPTWPDPGADNGWQRQRLALLPCPAGWCAADVPAQATAFREPLWLRPVTVQAGPAGGQALPPLPPGLQLISLRPRTEDPGEIQNRAQNEAEITVQNLTPARQRLDLGPHWQLVAKLAGGGAVTHACRDGGADEPGRVAPWQLARWWIRWIG
jgi:alpha-mannosidase